MTLNERSEPEPDVSVVPGSPRDYLDSHPAEVLLAVEVSESTLRFDRRRRGSLYAAAGIADYWIFNLVDGQLEVYRDPEPQPGTPYRTRLIIPRDGSIAPLAAPDQEIKVADLLP